LEIEAIYQALPREVEKRKEKGRRAKMDGKGRKEKSHYRFQYPWRQVCSDGH
jgi:hypothetical protein